MGTRFYLKFFCVFSKHKLPRKLYFVFFSLEKLALLPLVKEVIPSPDRKRVKLLRLTLNNLFLPL